MLAAASEGPLAGGEAEGPPNEPVDGPLLRGIAAIEGLAGASPASARSTALSILAERDEALRAPGSRAAANRCGNVPSEPRSGHAATCRTARPGCRGEGSMTSARPKEQRAAANSRYVGRRASAGIVKMTVMVPADRITELRGITLEWRRERQDAAPLRSAVVRPDPANPCRLPGTWHPASARGVCDARDGGILVARAPTGTWCAASASACEQGARMNSGVPSRK